MLRRTGLVLFLLLAPLLVVACGGGAKGDAAIWDQSKWDQAAWQ